MADRMKDLVGKAEALLAEMEALQKRLDETPDAKAREPIEGEFKAKDAEFGKTEKAIGAEKIRLQRENALAEAKGLQLITLDVKPAAKAADRAGEERELRGHFYGWMGGVKMPDKAHTILAPANELLAGKDAMCLPDSLCRVVIGPQWPHARGKAIPVDSTDIAPLIPEDRRMEVLELPPEPPSLLDRVRIEPAPRGRVVWPILAQDDDNEYGGIVFDDTTEGEDKPYTEPTFSDKTISCTEISGYTEVTHTAMRRSAVALDAYISRLFRDGLRAMLEDRILTGVGGPGGIGIVGIANTAGIREVVRAGAGAVAYADLVRLHQALRRNHRAGAVFVLADDAVTGLMLAVDALHRPIWLPAVSAAVSATIIGKPYLDTHRLALGDDGDVIFVDPRYFILAIEQDIVVERSADFRFRQNREAFRVHVHVGGRLVQPRAGAMLVASGS